jgi:N-acetylmuramoyl-L-alanine amidase
VFGVVVKLLASAAALVCVLVLVPSASAAGDFELRAPERARATVEAPRAFNLVGLKWRGNATPDVEIRARGRGGWSRWRHLGVHGRGGSDPAWVGRARTVQYRLDRRVPRLRLHFVSVGRQRPRVHARASQTPAPFPYVPRSDWAGSSCPPRSAPDYGSVRAVHVHHTVSLNDYTPAEAPQVVLAICRYHRNSNGWNDIGYNALVDRFGTIYEGRAGGLDQAVVGAQAQGFNSQTAGVAHIGDNSSVAATPEALSSIADYIRWKLTVHGQPLSGPVTVTSAGGSASRYPAGTRVTLERVIGHRDTGKTACPGDALYAQLPDIRALVESGATLGTPGTHVSAWLGDYRVEYGQVVPVTGALFGPDGAPLGGQPAEVQVNSENAWRTSRRVLTSADGAVLTDLKPRKRMYVRLRYPGGSGVAPATSARMLLRLRPLVEFNRPPRNARRWQRLVLRGSVKPRKRVVNVVLQQRIRGRWRKVGTRAVRTRRGRFTTSFLPGFNARYRYYAAVRSDLDTDRAATKMHALRVR